MDQFILQAVLLYIAMCFCPLQSQDNSLFPPTFLNVSKDLGLQQLLLEWDVGDEAYNSEREMVFNIQINQTGATDLVWNVNYTTTLNKSNRPIQWMWVSKAPLECMLFAVRIRSLVISENVPVSETWSHWTESKEVKGMDIEDSKAYLFPSHDIVVEKGSNITFCCIGKKGERIQYLMFGTQNYLASTSHRRMVFTVENVPLSKPGGIAVLCNNVYPPGTIVFVTRPPGDPKDLSCETEDMVTLNCAWQPGSEDNLAGNHSIKFILSDMSKGKINCLPHFPKNTCSFKIGTQTTYNLTLTARNDLGEKYTNLVFDVAHRVHPVTPSDLSVSESNSSAIELRWKVKHKLELLCQIECRHPDGKVELHNSTSHSTETYHITSGLQPYTRYSFRVRCGADRHFWKWSEWSESKTGWTKESAPSGHLDVWRSISPGLDSCNVTLFWKPLPSFHANGEIRTYEIFYERLGERSMPEEVPASNNSTMIFLNNCSYTINVLAKNSVNSSSPSAIVISAASENDHMWEINTSASKDDTINNTETGIYISWKPQGHFDGYIIDWCNHPRAKPCDFQWKKFGQNQSSALIISDAFTPGVKYTFGVYGAQGNRASLLEKKARYLKELEPPSFPELHIVTATSQLLKITWDYDHNESLPGFIRGYNVHVKAKHGNCTFKGSEQLVIPDSSVICKYTIEDPAKKTLTVKQPGPSKEYWLEVLAFSTIPPNITDTFIKGTAVHLRKVTIPPDGSWVFQLLLLLMVVPLMLIICICFCRSDRVRNCCCPKIPYPTVTPFKVLQLYPRTLSAASDLTPNNIIVEEHKSQPWSGEEKHYLSQDLPVEMPAVETFAFQNVTYFTEDANRYQNLQLQGAERQKPRLVPASYKPLECLIFTSNLASLNYLSQMDVPFAGVKQGSRASLDPAPCPEYKPQQAIGSESSTPDTSEETTETLW
ncbi:oncostatin-M-specific receptor subunit beta-like [Eublepharis macularius]|uniref:Oncostatin-M-specific receptor subunit beta-like n=1 Tax=Eublepharis macularius TaxID=481883 RepID=A0AA97JUY6_EUBMA|nr:oncostatin-M-specific receptor subunit beta-like [Eublepharis macularius]